MIETWVKVCKSISPCTSSEAKGGVETPKPPLNRTESRRDARAGGARCAAAGPGRGPRAAELQVLPAAATARAAYGQASNYIILWPMLSKIRCNFRSLGCWVPMWRHRSRAAWCCSTSQSSQVRCPRDPAEHRSNSSAGTAPSHTDPSLRARPRFSLGWKEYLYIYFMQAECRTHHK